MEHIGFQVIGDHLHFSVDQYTRVEAWHRWWDGCQELFQQRRIGKLTLAGYGRGASAASK
jgi:hypothetical protein